MAHRRAFHTHADEGILRCAYDIKVILIPSEEKFKGKIVSGSERKEIFRSSMEGVGGDTVDSEDRKRPSYHPTECSGINSRIPVLADVLAAGVERWSNRTDRC